MPYNAKEAKFASRHVFALNTKTYVLTPIFLLIRMCLKCSAIIINNKIYSFFGRFSWYKLFSYCKESQKQGGGVIHCLTGKTVLTFFANKCCINTVRRLVLKFCKFSHHLDICFAVVGAETKNFRRKTKCGSRDVFAPNLKTYVLTPNFFVSRICHKVSAIFLTKKIWMFFVGFSSYMIFSGYIDWNRDIFCH